MDSHVERQPLFPEPRRVVDRYAASDNEGAEEDAGKVWRRTSSHDCALPSHALRLLLVLMRTRLGSALRM